MMSRGNSGASLSQQPNGGGGDEGQGQSSNPYKELEDRDWGTPN